MYITQEQHERLRELHNKTHVPEAIYVREGIDMMLDKYDALAKTQPEARAGSDCVSVVAALQRQIDSIVSGPAGNA